MIIRCNIDVLFVYMFICTAISLSHVSSVKLRPKSLGAELPMQPSRWGWALNQDIRQTNEAITVELFAVANRPTLDLFNMMYWQATSSADKLAANEIGRTNAQTCPDLPRSLDENNEMIYPAIYVKLR